VRHASPVRQHAVERRKLRGVRQQVHGGQRVLERDVRVPASVREVQWRLHEREERRAVLALHNVL
jgi:hypothetical protein